MTDRKAAGISMAAIAAAVAARLLQLAGLHPLNWDEIEFFRATDWVRQGLVPYRDFWEHHTPLQWFVFAPAAALTRSPGADAIILMRWAQLPLWIITFLLLDVWMRDAGVTRPYRWCATAVPLTSSFFLLPAVEYRVDVLGCALLVAGLVLLRRSPFAAGAVFALAAFANIRLGPVLVITMLLARWRGKQRDNWIFAGGAAVTALGAIYFVATGSLALAVQRVWTDNYLAPKSQQNVAGMLVHRLVAPFGLRLLRPEGVGPFSASAIDPGGIVLVVLGAMGLVRALARRRAGDDFFFLACVQVAGVLFTAVMKVVFNYHMLIIAVLAVPFVALELERIGRMRAVAAALVVCAAVNVAVAVFRGKEGDTAYQDFIMREADRRTPPDAPVFDSAGWVLRRRSAYQFWFLRDIVRQLERAGSFPPYTPERMMADPPAVVVADHDAVVWMLLHPRLGQFITAHYIPLWRDLWVPGMSAVVAPGRTVRWVAPAAGDYRVIASARLAAHPWFRNPFAAARMRVPPVDANDPSVALAFSPPPVDGRIRLHKSEPLAVSFAGTEPVGVMLLRDNPSELFRQPPPGVTLEASASPQWHIPDLRWRSEPSAFP
jgi:hypothetical protein